MTEQSTETDALLQSFLASRDTSCPGCRYNLRGVEGRSCPECGRELVLSVLEASPFDRRRGLLTLVFLWLLLAGTMNGYRSVRSIHRTVTTPSSVAIFSTVMSQLNTLSGAVSFTTPAGTAPTPPGTSPVLVIDPARAAGGTGAAGAPSSVTITTGGTTITAPSLQITTGTPPGAGGLAWSRVGWLQWVEVTWWSGLAAVAAVAVVLVIRARRRTPSHRRARVLTRVAWLGFAGYMAYHVVNFARAIA